MSITSAAAAPPIPDTAPSPGATPAGTAVLEREVVLDPVEPGDHERFAHYVRKEKIVESAVTGAPVIALCGKVWTPGRDPKRFPVCPTCKEIFEGLRPGDDAGGPTGSDGPGST